MDRKTIFCLRLLDFILDRVELSQLLDTITGEYTDDIGGT